MVKFEVDVTINRSAGMSLHIWATPEKSRNTPV